jgi:hypothetical protein
MKRETAPVCRAWSQALEGFTMRSCAVAFMGSKAITRVYEFKLAQHCIPGGFRQNGGSRNAQ